MTKNRVHIYVPDVDTRPSGSRGECTIKIDREGACLPEGEKLHSREKNTEVFFLYQRIKSLVQQLFTENSGFRLLAAS